MISLSHVMDSIGIGPIEPYVIADLYAWLEAHSGLSHSSVTTATASTIGANTSSLNTRLFLLQVLLVKDEISENLFRLPKTD